MKQFFVITGALALLGLGGCVDPRQEAARAVSAYGFSHIDIGNYAWFGCGKDDSWGYSFNATNVAGAPVQGVVCGGWQKGATVRITG